MYQLSRGSTILHLTLSSLSTSFSLSILLCALNSLASHTDITIRQNVQPAYLSSRLSLHLQTLDIESSPSSLGSSLSLALSAQVTALPANEPITTFKSTKVYYRYQTFSVDVG